MLKKIIRKVLGRSTAAHSAHKAGHRQEIGPSRHKINRALIDPRAIDVVQTIQEAGFEAYLVGGAVRDLLLGITPKDFDIATDATPEEVKKLFKRAFIIGRRFRLVHVVCGRGHAQEVFEVSTFRAAVHAQESTRVRGSEKSRAALEGLKHAVDSSGRVLRDNVWGDIASDAARRDFTINAMYYDPGSEVLVDYHGGMADAKRRVLRIIGDPGARYREDPVRMIRAVRFAAKLSHLGFTLEDASRKPLARLKGLLSDVPPSRLFDEMFKLLQTGHSIASIEALRATAMADAIDPLLSQIVKRSREPMLATALADTDARVLAGKSVSPSYLLACALWQDVRTAWQRRLGVGAAAPYPALMEAIEEVFEQHVGDISGRSKLGADVREIWALQPRFEKRTGGSALTLAAHLRFRAAYDFLCLRARSGEDPTSQLSALASWWEEFQYAGQARRAQMQHEVRLGLQPSPRSRRTPQLREQAVPPLQDASDEALPEPSRRRHRRRKAPSTTPPEQSAQKDAQHVHQTGDLTQHA